MSEKTIALIEEVKGFATHHNITEAKAAKAIINGKKNRAVLEAHRAALLDRNERFITVGCDEVRIGKLANIDYNSPLLEEALATFTAADGTFKAPKHWGPRLTKFQVGGNRKLGQSMYSFSTLAGNRQFGNCKGTCSDNCTGCWSEDWRKSPCYVAQEYVRYGEYGGLESTVALGHAKNTESFRINWFAAMVDLATQIARAKEQPKVVRIDHAGEIEWSEWLFAFTQLADWFPKVKFYIYTKAYDKILPVFGARLSVFDKHSLPKNFFLNISVWEEFGVEEFEVLRELGGENVRAFCVKPKGLTPTAFCPAYTMNKNGKVALNHEVTCDKCGLCFSTRHPVLGCLEH